MVPSPSRRANEQAGGEEGKTEMHFGLAYPPTQPAGYKTAQWRLDSSAKLRRKR